MTLRSLLHLPEPAVDEPDDIEEWIAGLARPEPTETAPATTDTDDTKGDDR